MTVTCDITLTPIFQFQNKIKEEENRNEKGIENN